MAPSPSSGDPHPPCTNANQHPTTYLQITSIVITYELGSMLPNPNPIDKLPFVQRWKASFLSKTRFQMTGTSYQFGDLSSTTTPPTTHHLSRDWLPLIKDHPGMSLFHAAQTFADLLYLTNLYLSGQIASSLSCLSPTYLETNLILDDLLFLNSRGIVTVSSQPGEVEENNRGEMRGKGDANHRRQRAYIEGFCTLEVAQSIAENAKAMHDRISSHILISLVPITPHPLLSAIVPVATPHEDPFPVTETYHPNTKHCITTTTVSFSAPLNEVDQFFIPRYASPGEVVQIVVASVEWGVGTEWWDLLRRLVDVGMFHIVNPFVAIQ